MNNILCLVLVPVVGMTPLKSSSQYNNNTMQIDVGQTMQITMVFAAKDVPATGRHTISSLIRILLLHKNHCYTWVTSNLSRKINYENLWQKIARLLQYSSCISERLQVKVYLLIFGWQDHIICHVIIGYNQQVSKCIISSQATPWRWNRCSVRPPTVFSRRISFF